MPEMLPTVGKLLRSIALPVPLLAVVLDLWEQTVFVGSSDGQIFQIAVVSQLGSSPVGTTSLAGASLEEQGVHSLTGHTGAVNSLSVTSCGYHLVSGLAISTLPEL